MVWLEQHTGLWPCDIAISHKEPHKLQTKLLLCSTDERAMRLPFLDSPVVPLLYLGAYLLAIVLGKKYVFHEFCLPRRRRRPLGTVCVICNLLSVSQSGL